MICDHVIRYLDNDIRSQVWVLISAFLISMLPRIVITSQYANENSSTNTAHPETRGAVEEPPRTENRLFCGAFATSNSAVDLAGERGEKLHMMSLWKNLLILLVFKNT